MAAQFAAGELLFVRPPFDLAFSLAPSSLPVLFFTRRFYHRGALRGSDPTGMALRKANPSPSP